MNILITGATGLIGTALTEPLTAQQHVVYPLLRNASTGVAFFWQPAENSIHLDEAIAIDVVIHLAGESIAEGRWNAQKKNRILNSRVQGTRLLCEALARLENKPKLLISASAIGYYGDTGDQAVDETSEAGTGFLAKVSQKWEQSTAAASQAGIRTVNIRTGIVLSPQGGVLQKMLTPFKMGLGGVIGNGQQYMSWISINDIRSMISFIIENESISGPVNLVSNHPVTNQTFTRTLGKALNRPTLLPMPAVLARTMFGEMADALLLSSSRVLPKKLNAAGYRFIDNDLEKAFSSLLKN
jgi:uncharacterized protein (TIGR01777 family)